MIRTWMTFGLSSLLAVGLGAPAFAGGGADDKGIKEIQNQLKMMNDALSKGFERAAADVTEIRKDIKEIKDEGAEAQLKLKRALGKIESLEKAIERLQTDMENLKKRSPASDVSLYPPLDKGALQDIQAKLKQIEQDLTRLQGSGRVSQYPSASAIGRVLLVNSYPDDMYFIVNGQTHFLTPGMTATLDNVPAGTVSYKVYSRTYGSRADVRTQLAPNETLTLTTSPERLP